MLHTVSDLGMELFVLRTCSPIELRLRAWTSPLNALLDNSISESFVSHIQENLEANRLLLLTTAHWPIHFNLVDTFRLFWPQSAPTEHLHRRVQNTPLPAQIFFFSLRECLCFDAETCRFFHFYSSRKTVVPCPTYSVNNLDSNFFSPCRRLLFLMKVSVFFQDSCRKREHSWFMSLFFFSYRIERSRKRNQNNRKTRTAQSFSGPPFRLFSIGFWSLKVFMTLPLNVFRRLPKWPRFVVPSDHVQRRKVCEAWTKETCTLGFWWKQGLLGVDEIGETGWQMR